MTMHLEGPWLSTTGKQRGKRKYASAEAKRRAEILREDWEAFKQANGITTTTTEARAGRNSNPMKPGSSHAILRWTTAHFIPLDMA